MGYPMSAGENNDNTTFSCLPLHLQAAVLEFQQKDETEILYLVLHCRRLLLTHSGGGGWRARFWSERKAKPIDDRE